ncbi:hypothetical protein [Peribacillus butanolivorans]
MDLFKLMEKLVRMNRRNNWWNERVQLRTREQGHAAIEFFTAIKNSDNFKGW